MENYVYIKNSIAKHFVSFAEPLSAEEYNNLGTTWADYINNKWVPLDAGQVAFLEEHPTASVKEVWDMQLAPAHIRTLTEAKRQKIDEIDSYDSSDNVNDFIVNNVFHAWLTPEERANYRNSIDAAKLLGIDSVSLYIGDNLITISTTTAELLLAQIQLYADQCYIVTKGHKAAVEALNSIEAVDDYDFTVGYPQKLIFTV